MKCRELFERAYNSALSALAGNGSYDLMFGAGFVAGQCEKVHLRVCRACMFRIVGTDEQKYRKRVVVESVARAYGLTVQVGGHGDTEELWVRHYDDSLDIGLYDNPGSPEWNMKRAAACGIPVEEIDLNWPAD